MSETDEQVNKLAKEAALSQYGADSHEEYESTVNGYIMGYNEAISQMQPEWVLIANKSDLPEKSCEMWVFDKPSQKVVRGSFIASQEYYDYWLANASHYIIIDVPQPPIT